MIADQKMRSDGRTDDRTGPAAKAGADVPGWQAFEERLAAALARMAVDTFLVVSTHAGTETPYYVQFAQGGRPGFRAEAVSNTYLEGPRALSPDQEETLGQLGWQWPSPHGTQDRNFSRQWPMSVPFRVVAHLAVRTLREAYGVGDPSELVYRRFDDEGNVFGEPGLGIEQLDLGAGSPTPMRRRPVADSRRDAQPDLDDVAEAGVRDFLHIDDVVRDHLGDIPIRVGDVRMIVRTLDGPSLAIRVFSPVLRDVAGGPALLEAINEANMRLRYARVLWVDQEVLVAAEVPGAHAMPELVSLMCTEVCGLAESVGEDLGARFGREPGRRPLVN
jgi:hypothetical protein